VSENLKKGKYDLAVYYIIQVNMLTKDSVIELRSGVKMPVLGFGVFEIKPMQMEESIHCAVETGFRLFDTAAAYGNEKYLGKALRTCGLKREEFFITTKLWTDDVRAGRTREACLESMDALQVDVLDLYLIHWPVPGFEDAWIEMAKLQQEGLVRAIGVSNFDIPQIKSIFDAGGPMPEVHQMEYHPYKTQDKWRKYACENGIQTEAYGPFMQGGMILRDPRIVEIANTYGKTSAQLILRWNLQNGVIPIPKSVTPSRIRQNFEVFDFEISEADMQKINACNINRGNFQDPYNIWW